MNVTMCANNHYFDNDMYDSCPICGAAVKSNTRNEYLHWPMIRKRRRAFFIKIRKV